MRGHRHIGTWAFVTVFGLAGGTPAGPLVAAPQMVEPGFRVRHLDSCGYGYNNGLPGAGLRASISTGACTPGGPWGDHLLLAAKNSGLDFYYVEAVDADGSSRYYALGGTGEPDDYTNLAFSPLGWRGGDLLFATLHTAINDSTQVLVQTPSGTAGPPIHLPTGLPPLVFPSATALAVDPSGDFGNDLFFEVNDWFNHVYLGVYREDAAGNTTLFSASGRVGRFGPGGAWGTGLYGEGAILDPSGALTPFPVNFGRDFDWVEGPGFGGDMFAECGSAICRIRPNGDSTIFATGTLGTTLRACFGSLWLAGGGGCDVISAIQLEGAAEISPAALNIKGQGNDVTFRLTVSDSGTGQALDPTQLSPMWISRVTSPSIGTVTLPTPSAAAGCNDATQDGIWETTSKRAFSAQDGTLKVSFSTPSDGLCATMDGNRQDIIALLADVPDGEAATICVSGLYPGYLAPVEACASVAVQNQRNR